MTILYGPAQGEAKKINKLYGGAVVMTSLNRDTSVQTVLVTAIDEDKFAKKISVWAGGAGKGVFVNDEITAIKIEHSSSSSTSDYAFFLTGADPSVPGGQKDVLIFGGSYFPVADVAGQWGITITSSNVPVVDNIPVSPTYADQSWKITRMYGPAGTIVSEVTGEIQPGGDGNVVAFNGETFSEAVKSMTYFWELLSATADQISLEISHLNNYDYYYIRVYSNGQDINKHIGSGDADRMALYGITISDTPTTGGIDYVDLTRNGYSPMAKLIYQGFGHFPYYGQIVYYTDASHTDTGVILLKNQSQINQLCGSWQGWETEIEGVQLNSADIKEVYIEKQAESIPQGFLIACSSIDTVDLSESEITSIPANFLSYCSNFNGTLKLPPATQTIGSRFLYEAKHFNQPLTIPTGVTSINYNFLYNASAFNQPITLPPSLVSLGNQFLYGCNKMTSTVNVGSLSADIATYNDRTLATNSSSAAMYRTGVTIAGSNRAAWLAKFPNSNSVPFRKLVDAGY